MTVRVAKPVSLLCEARSEPQRFRLSFRSQNPSCTVCPGAERGEGLGRDAPFE